MIGRYEWKYLLNNHSSTLIRFNLMSTINMDINSEKEGYTVHSLYFDDKNNNAFYDVDFGSNKRFKYRIRYYNYDSSKIYLEKKTKINDICIKNNVIISNEEYLDIINNNVAKYLYSNKKLLKELSIKMISDQLKPKIIIEYNRIAFEEVTSNTRITVDKNICFSKDINNYINGTYLKCPLKYGDVLEIKFGEILPNYIKTICNINDIHRTSFSKYYLSTMSLNGGKLL